MNFFNINITDIESCSLKRNVTIPLFIVVTAGKLVPESIIKFLLRDTDAGAKSSREMKQIYGIVAEVLQEASKDEKLKKYAGIIATIEENGDRIVISIK
ncbi:hypothetical protein [Agarivorans sp. 1_MG-2023]|uniref:hypothetical protein n=1 Tax=Agarivorans sp. 1_MG-2023 TaxID=3062634 RepID=UPI0026E17C4A|nr:hypothetical protein [Agarivorans sp. 1_MG-2023]MDO6765812.1 hypothetical protein [Agarivorans sp. 1_MG-2023]